MPIYSFDNLQRTARKRILLAIELLDLEQQRILAGDALALALQSKADMVCKSNENLVVDINIELSTEHLNNVLGNHEIDGGMDSKRCAKRSIVRES